MPSYLAYLELFIPMDEAVYQKSTSFNLCSTGNNGTNIVSCKTTAPKKKLRIFGFEVNPCLKDSICSRSDRDESINSSETFADDKPEDKTSHWMNSSGTVLPNPNENLRNLSSSAIMELKYECHFCLKKFASSRALGGHQNAHRKERLKKKRTDLEAKRASSMFHLYALIRDNGVTNPYSFLGHQDLSFFVPTIVYGSPLISFSSKYHCQNDYSPQYYTLIQGGESRGRDPFIVPLSHGC